jgi:hypothetical protein
MVTAIATAMMIISVTSQASLAPRHVLTAHPRGVFQPQFLENFAILALLVNRGGRAIYLESAIALTTPLSKSQTSIAKRIKWDPMPAALQLVRPSEGNV